MGATHALDIVSRTLMQPGDAVRVGDDPRVWARLRQVEPAGLFSRTLAECLGAKQRGQGTGLGLSMTFGYVKQIGGHLKIYSEIGHGTSSL